MITVSELLKPYRDRIEPALDAACDFTPDCPGKLRDAIRYAVLAPGKRLRPALVMMAAEACGGRAEDAIAAAVSVEMMHAYSLIHDDLPAMDDDDLRRGRPTTHIVFGESTAILAGDALQSEAFAQLYAQVPDRMLAALLMGELAIACGASGLVGGQEDDLATEQTDVADFGSAAAALNHLESIHRRKTGALFVACARMGAIAAGGSEEQVQTLGRFADTFGLAFQITDDVLDFTASDEQLGKRTGKDSDRGKFTFPDLMAAQQAQATELDLKRSGVTLAEVAAPSRSSVSIDKATGRELGLGIGLARQRAAALIGEARHSLELFEAPAERLRQLADYILERTS